MPGETTLTRYYPNLISSRASAAIPAPLRESSLIVLARLTSPEEPGAGEMNPGILKSNENVSLADCEIRW